MIILGRMMMILLKERTILMVIWMIIFMKTLTILINYFDEIDNNLDYDFDEGLDDEYLDEIFFCSVDNFDDNDLDDNFLMIKNTW